MKLRSKRGGDPLFLRPRLLLFCISVHPVGNSNCETRKPRPGSLEGSHEVADSSKHVRESIEDRSKDYVRSGSPSVRQASPSDLQAVLMAVSATAITAFSSPNTVSIVLCGSAVESWLPDLSLLSKAAAPVQT